jgi:hypothetical protein
LVLVHAACCNGLRRCLLSSHTTHRTHVARTHAPTHTHTHQPCGHCIHHKCHQEYIQTSYQCPTCSKSLANMTEYFKRIDLMLAQHQMPPEYAAMHSSIYCNDCEKRSVAKYHFLYHKCQHCRGYNTKVLKTSDLGEVALQRASSPVAPAAAAAPGAVVTGDELPPPGEGQAQEMASDSGRPSTASTDFQSMPSGDGGSFSSLDLDSPARTHHHH